MTDNVTVLPSPTQRRKRRVPSEIMVTFLDDHHPLSFPLADTADWAVIFEDILEIRGEDGISRFIPIANLKEWNVRKADGSKREKEEGD